MLSKKNTKRLVNYLLLPVFAVYLLMGIGFAKTASAAPSEESQHRRYVTALIQCLQHIPDALGLGDTDESSMGKWLNAEFGVVGLDMELPNGVVQCSTALNESAKLFTTVESGTDSVTWLLNNILPNGGTFNDYDNRKVSVSKMLSGIGNLINNTLVPYANSIPITDEELAYRLLPIADFCYGYKLGSFDRNAFEATAANGAIGATELDISGADVANFANLFKNDGFSLRLGNANRAHLGAIELGFNYGGNADFGIGGFDGAYVSDFLPLGADNLNNVEGLNRVFTDGNNSGAGNGTIKDCHVIKDLKDRIFPFYTIDPTTYKLSINGKTAADILSEAPQTADLNLSQGDNVASCEGADVLGWIACPLVTGLLNLSDTIFQKFIVPFLSVDPINTNDGVIYTIWSSFRTIGNVILIFALLFIVFGQAIGGGLVDAYTAKKAMPRIFIGAILINLSIYIVAFMVDIGNILGSGVGELITSPLAATGQDKFVLDGVVGLVTIVGVALVIAIPILVVVLLKKYHGSRNNTELGPNGNQVPTQQASIYGRLLKGVLYFGFFIAIPLLLLILSIFATLIIRLGTIMILCVISPVALALFVLPSTEKWSKKWFEFLIKAILVYPIIVAIFAIAAVLGSLLSSNSGGIDFLGFSKGFENLFDINSLLSAGLTSGLSIPEAFFNLDGPGILFSIVSLLVMFAPLMMIPFAFKLAGGIMGTILNASVKGRGGIDKVIRGDKHNPHSRFYSMWGKEGYIGRKYGDLKTVEIREFGQALKNVGGEKNEDGTLKFPSEAGPDKDPSGTATGLGRFGFRKRRTRINPAGGVGRTPYGPPSPTPTAPAPGGTVTPTAVPADTPAPRRSRSGGAVIINDDGTVSQQSVNNTNNSSAQQPTQQASQSRTSTPSINSPTSWDRSPGGVWVPSNGDQFKEPRQQGASRDTEDEDQN